MSDERHCVNSTCSRGGQRRWAGARARMGERLDGTVVFVTGASSGICEATAHAFAAEDAAVAGSGR